MFYLAWSRDSCKYITFNCVSIKLLVVFLRGGGVAKSGFTKSSTPPQAMMQVYV